MRRNPLFLFSILAASGAVGAQAADAAAETSAFATKLGTCEPAELSTPHPFMRGFDSQHRIEGEQQGACRYTQSMPGDMRMECALSAAGRTALADNLVEMAAGRMQGSTQAAPAWAKECEIVTADGKRMPAFGKSKSD